MQGHGSGSLCRRFTEPTKAIHSQRVTKFILNARSNSFSNLIGQNYMRIIVHVINKIASFEHYDNGVSYGHIPLLP